MEDPTIVEMDLERFQRLLESEADPDKRQAVQELIRKAKAELEHGLVAACRRGWIVSHPRMPRMTDAGQPEAGLDDPCGSPERAAGSDPEALRRESFAAAVHGLSERLTAASDYVASGLRLFEMATADRRGCSETLEKALEQIDRAGDIVRALRKLPD